MKKGTLVRLANGDEAVLLDSASGLTRTVSLRSVAPDVDGFRLVMAHEIVAANPGGAWEDVELNASQTRQKLEMQAEDRWKNAG